MNKNKKTAHPDQMSAMQFRVFVSHVPGSILKKYKIRRPSFVAVAMMLAQYCDYETGTRVRATQTLLADVTGCDRKTVRDVLELLEQMGALVTVGKQTHAAGKPSQIREFRLSRVVRRVLELEDRHFEQKETDEPEAEYWGTDTVITESTPHLTESTPHNKSRKSLKNHSLADAHSHTPSGASPDGRAEAWTVDEKMFEELIRDL